MDARTRAGIAGIAVATAAAVASCRQVLGVGDVTFTGGPGGAASGSSTGGKAQSSGSGGAGSSQVSGSGGAGGSCTVTHPGGGTCEYLPGKACGCSTPTQKCTIIDPKTGASACVSAGTTADYDACTADADCLAGSWCELSALVCEPICEASCPSGTCVTALQSSLSAALPIPGLHVCRASCDPVSVAPCGAGATCVIITTDAQGDIGSACFASADIAEGAPCAHPQDCKPGLACTESSSGSMSACASWCTASDDPCIGQGLNCDYFSPTVKLGGTEYGYCGP